MQLLQPKVAISGAMSTGVLARVGTTLFTNALGLVGLAAKVYLNSGQAANLNAISWRIRWVSGTPTTWDIPLTLTAPSALPLALNNDPNLAHLLVWTMPQSLRFWWPAMEAWATLSFGATLNLDCWGIDQDDLNLEDFLRRQRSTVMPP